ncbi:MAG: carbohydrate deacetylase [Pigmentiphaga sp.]|uniref:carbohydrate deacetylase n=1 Tax=Pigmentiphaga sp. TaxID=1977564 RepID=UPI003B55A465
MSAPKKLIINADGYGFTPGVNAGIIKTFEFGLVKSTSCTPNFGFLEDVGKVAQQFPEVSFGIHFNLSVGPPLASPSRVSSLLGSNGEFHAPSLLKRLLTGKIEYSHLVEELSSQAAILADAGVRISHWDGHQNKHLYPIYYAAALEVARKFGIKGIRTHRRQLFGNSGPIPFTGLISYYTTHPSRLITHAGGRLRAKQAIQNGHKMADRLITPGYADSSHKSERSFWHVLAETLPYGVSEIYCHPAYPDDLLRAHAKYVEQRALEVEHLTDPTLRAAFEENQIELISFHQI